MALLLEQNCFGVKDMEPEGVLGIKRKNSPLMEKGLPYRALRHFQEVAGLTQAQVSEVFGIPKRTITHRASQGLLSPHESDRLYRGARIFARAVDLFEGDTEAAREWMNSPEIAFNGAKPIDMVGTDRGAQEVASLIERLEEGMPA
jgi:putative toxin-antitoxin system antitoxin component (TIGR02293 family)